MGLYEGRAKSCEYLPDRTIRSILDRGVWMRHIYEVQLDGGEALFFKITVHPQSITDARHEARVARLLSEHGLPAHPNDFMYRAEITGEGRDHLRNMLSRT